MQFYLNSNINKRNTPIFRNCELQKKNYRKHQNLLYFMVFTSYTNNYLWISLSVRKMLLGENRTMSKHETIRNVADNSNGNAIHCHRMFYSWRLFVIYSLWSICVLIFDANLVEWHVQDRHNKLSYNIESFPIYNLSIGRIKTIKAIFYSLSFFFIIMSVEEFRYFRHSKIDFGVKRRPRLLIIW